MDRGEKMVKIEAQPKQLYKPIRRDITDLKLNWCFYLFLDGVQRGSWDVQVTFLLNDIQYIIDLIIHEKGGQKPLQGSSIR